MNKQDLILNNDRITIIADYREPPELLLMLKEMGVEVVQRNLEVGDYVVSSTTVVERKTRRDFENSIIDGRLFSQLEKMKESYENVVVIVEGTSEWQRIRKEALLGAYASLITDYKVGLFFTRSMEKTAELLFAIAKHEQKAGKKPRIAFSKKPKTLSEQQLFLLQALPLIGERRAKALLKAFKTIRNIANASPAQLERVEGIGKKRAKIIWQIFWKEWKDEAQ